MASLTNINNNAAVVNVGRTVPVSAGPQSAVESIPVVIATDQTAIPVEEQNKVQSEVALSLLGIPRAEVALGIFADVNTYDVNPTEWSTQPEYYAEGHGIKHIPAEAGALVEAPRNKSAILTSKRFFRYQPGRVSAATFGIKSSISQASFAKNPVIRKYGISDKYDGYYWESRQSGEGDNFTVVRRTQSLLKNPTSIFGNAGSDLRGNTLAVDQLSDYRMIGHAPNYEESEGLLARDRAVIIENRFEAVEAALTAAAIDYAAIKAAIEANPANGTISVEEIEEKCRRDADYWIDMYLMDLKYGGDAHTAYNTKNFLTADKGGVALLVQPSAEASLYAALKTELQALLTPASEAHTKIGVLVDITTAFFTSSTAGSSAPAVTPTSFGSKTKLETFFDVRKNFWAYKTTKDGTIFTYSPSTINDLNGNVYLDLSTSFFDVDDIKAKCHRDVVYVADGYKDDLLSGPSVNASTKYNASMFLRGNGLSVFSQQISGLPVEINVHTQVKADILADLNDSYFGLSSYVTRLGTLADIIINNFTVENADVAVYGDRPVLGNLVAMRDGLPMIHAAVFDPSLLKEQVKTKSLADATANTFKLTDGNVTFGQRVKIFTQNGNDINTSIKHGGLYIVKKVYGTKGNSFDLMAEGDTANATLTFTQGELDGTTTVAGSNIVFVQTVNPFIFPKHYDPAYYRTIPAYLTITQGQTTDETDPLPKGMMFPYMYSNQNLTESLDFSTGYINTALDPVEFDGDIRQQYDNVNFTPEYINWIKNNVKPEYWGVYEYRIPRSRFSTDQLNGQENAQVYSDVATGEGGVVRPGMPVQEDNIQKISTSVYDFDFTKVSMLKIEFSWYGAVGALFLAYVPVSNDEARWVRVHHLRASNQLKIPSLGNATLPITYNVYGGGDELSLGDGESGADYNYGRDSHNLVKYGASYYIDGGDRGTVRLYSHTNDTPVNATGRKFPLSGSGSTYSNGVITYVGPVDPVFFMGARVDTGSRADNNIKVVWVNGNDLVLSGNTNSTNINNFVLVPDRSTAVYSIDTKRFITSTQGRTVRNRVQVYPTKLSTANLGTEPVRLTMKKTPIFQTDVTTSGTFVLDSDYEVTSANLPLDTSSANYMLNGETIYGWLRGSIQGTTETITVFVKLYKDADEYYIDVLQSYNGVLVIDSTEAFLEDKVFSAEGLVTNHGKAVDEIENLSSVELSVRDQVPIPGTGSSVATIFMQPGTEQIQLNTYFDYNKEYLSFPLTDIADTLYFAVDTELNSTDTAPEVSVGVTWEEQ